MRPPLLYVGTVVAFGGLAIVAAVAGWPVSTPWLQWLTISGVVWLSSTLALRVPGTHLTITVSETLSFITAIVFGWQPAVLTVAADGLFTSLRQRNVRVDRTAFNVAEPALSMAACGLVLDWMSGLSPAQRTDATLVQLLVPVFAATSTYLLLNSTLITAALALESRTHLFTTWRRHVVWLLLDQMGATSLALLVVAGLRGSDVVGLFVALPLLGALYVAFRSSIKRAEEALHYAERLNRLYLDTVESLATAIDAKDHVTHGHITRVRTLAVRLAERLGLRDDTTIKAIEAGALLHDVGKLGVPDHILNKPGRLTPDEYEQVKRHAVIGAEIVSRVRYPYPVAPVVRHHHENWDGTGYPDGLRGEAIPVGARILSVVDCYDALTSDRPYRRAMSPEAALRIVAERRGTMYDPAVVDALVALSADDGLELAPARPPLSVTQGAGAAGPAGVLAPATATPHARLADARAEECREIMQRLAGPLVASTRASAIALFVPAEAGGTLRPAWAAGRIAPSIASLRPEMGRGLSGWVAAHRVTLLNAEADLEFQGAAPAALPRYALSVPVEFEDGATGALTLYSDDAPFTGGDPHMALVLAHAVRGGHGEAGAAARAAATGDAPPPPGGISEAMAS